MMKLLRNISSFTRVPAMDALEEVVASGGAVVVWKGDTNSLCRVGRRTFL